MSEVTIGRFGTSFDVDAAKWSTDGRTVNASGYIDNSDRDLIALARQQVLGLADSPDEPAVPVTFASDSSQDGYYLVTGASVDMDVSRYAAKSLPWSVNLERVPDFGRPVVEIRTLGDVRTNVASFTTGNISPTVAWPGDVVAVSLPTSSPTAYTTAFGIVDVSTHDDYLNRRTPYRLAPADYYDGACRVEQKIGSTWYPVVGRQVKCSPLDLRVNNGLLRIAGYLDGTAANSGIQMESFVSGSTWGPVKTFNFRRSGAAFVADGPQSVEVLRNSPEEAIIRMWYPANTASVHTTLKVDVRVIRGHRMADVTLSSPQTVQHLLRSSVAMTSATGGYQASSDDANSQRHVVAVRGATTLTGSNLDVSYDNAATRPIVIGLGVRETTGSAPWGTVADTMARWFAYVGQYQRIQSPR